MTSKRNKGATQEFERLSKLEQHFSSKEGFNSRIISMRYETLKQFFRGRSCLELGSADGQGTQHLLPYFERVVALDASEKYTRELRALYANPKLEVVCSLIEEYQPKEQFDTIVLAHILEHVDQPVSILTRVRPWLKTGGVILIDVPNATSIHRMIGVKLGMLKKVTELHADDVRIGHRRVYSLKTLRADIRKAGLRIITDGGVFLKPVSNQQIVEHWTEPMIKAFYELGKDLPRLSSEIFVVAGE